MNKQRSRFLRGHDMLPEFFIPSIFLFAWLSHAIYNVIHVVQEEAYNEFP